MIYAQMFHRVNGEMVPACGGDSTCRIDGRFGRELQDRVARRYIRMLALNIRNFDGYQIMKGKSYTECKPITGVIEYNASMGNE